MFCIRESVPELIIQQNDKPAQKNFSCMVCSLIFLLFQIGSIFVYISHSVVLLLIQLLFSGTELTSSFKASFILYWELYQVWEQPSITVVICVAMLTTS